MVSVKYAGKAEFSFFSPRQEYKLCLDEEEARPVMKMRQCLNAVAYEVRLSHSFHKRSQY